MGKVRILEIKESVFAMQGDEPHRGKSPAGTSAETPSAPTRNGNFAGYGEAEQLTIFGTERNGKSVARGAGKERLR